MVTIILKIIMMRKNNDNDIENDNDHINENNHNNYIDENNVNNIQRE